MNLRGEGIGIAVAEWANAVLNNGLGNYEAAMEAAQRATEYPGEMIAPTWAAVELVEAAARSGHADVAADALARLAESDQRQRHRLGARRRGSFARAAE